jgi:hypothetical protein
MPKYLENKRVFFIILFIIASLGILLTWSIFSRPISIIILLTSISTTIAFTVRKHWQSYQQAECTREKMTRNLILDLFGLLFTMGAAMYIGRLAGAYFGIHNGFWIGLLAGFLGGFLAAWMVRSVWGKLVSVSA